jgi:predicted aspartyl protease
MGMEVERPPGVNATAHGGGCWYLRGNVGGSPIELLVDTGATVELIDCDVYHDLSPQYKTPLSETQASLHGADGNPLELWGKTEIKIATGDRKYSVEMIVAKLGHLQGILGMSFLRKHTSTIDTVNGHLTCGGVHHQLHHVKAAGCCRLRLQESVTLVSGEETLVHGYLDGDGPQEGSVLLEPNPEELFGLGLMMPRALVEAGSKVVAFTIANVGRTLHLLPSTPVAKAEAAEVVTEPLLERGGDCPGRSGQEEERLGKSPQGPPPLPVGSLNKGDSVSPADLDGMLVPEHLQDLYDRSIQGMDEARAHEVKTLLLEECDMFVGSGVSLGRTHLVKHSIDTGDAPPFKMGPRRQGPYLRQVAEDEVKKMLEDGIVRPSCSPWSSPVVLSKKKDGTFRFCVDYRKLNQYTRKDAYPLPCIGDCIDSLNGARSFCTLDLASGYWQVEMEEESKPKTAFVTHQGLFEFNVMSFGLTNAPATFERLMEMTLEVCNGNNV